MALGQVGVPEVFPKWVGPLPVGVKAGPDPYVAEPVTGLFLATQSCFPPTIAFLIMPVAQLL